VPETPQEFYDRVTEYVGSQPGGRLPVPVELTGSDIFPFEADGLQIRALEPPVVPEPARQGEADNSDCARCSRGDSDALWANDRWLLTPAGIDSLPWSAMLQPRDHLDFGELTPELAAEMGQLIVMVERAVKQLPGIARVHVNIVGDGARHLHVWLWARPLGQLQLRGSCIIEWSDVLPPSPAAIRDADAQRVASLLAEFAGGTARPAGM
jgi:diadenosine tetraphosphate (Ap4A) HIT family hydrolase